MSETSAYGREHGSERTEVRGDGSVAKFSDPTDKVEVAPPAQHVEVGTNVVDEVADPDEEEASE